MIALRNIPGCDNGGELESLYYWNILKGTHTCSLPVSDIGYTTHITPPNSAMVRTCVRFRLEFQFACEFEHIIAHVGWVHRRRHNH